MLKKILFYIICLSTLFYNNLEASVSREENTENQKNIKEGVLNTGINIEELCNLKTIEKTIVLSSKWIDYDHSCYNNFPSPEKKNQIYNTPAIFTRLHFHSGMIVSVWIANFKNPDDSRLGYLARFGLGEFNQTLLSGETIENAIVITQNYFNDSVTAYLKYKNCVCMFYCVQSQGPRMHGTQHSLQENDLKMIDILIKSVKNIIDKSLID